MRKNGFTMIEFLVVAALIGILATLGMASYSKSLSRGRDAKRISDMKETQKAFELYFSINNEYTTCENMYIPETGVDPSEPAGGLIYFGSCSATDYTYCTDLENKEDYGNASCGTPNVASTCSPDSVDPDSYCVYSVQ